MWRVDSELQKMLRESAVSYTEANAGPKHFRASRTLKNGFDSVAWKQMAELGWTGILLPEESGGTALGLEPMLTLAEIFGGSLSTEPLVASAVIAATILGTGTGERALALSQDLAAGDRVVTCAWQESLNQLDAGEPATRIEHSDGGLSLSGQKIFVPAWTDEAALLVTCGGKNGPAVVIVEPGMSGVEVTSQRMTDGTFSATIDFNKLRLDLDSIVIEGGGAMAAIELALARGTLALAVQLEGLASALWQLTLQYLQQRTQFDQKLGDFQAIRHRMVDLFGAIELAAASWRSAIADVENERLPSMALHAAKARCSEAALDMGRWAVQYHGAFGYTEEADIGLYLNAALRWSSWLGNAAGHRQKAFHTYMVQAHV